MSTGPAYGVTVGGAGAVRGAKLPKLLARTPPSTFLSVWRGPSRPVTLLLWLPPGAAFRVSGCSATCDVHAEIVSVIGIGDGGWFFDWDQHVLVPNLLRANLVLHSLSFSALLPGAG